MCVEEPLSVCVNCGGTSYDNFIIFVCSSMWLCVALQAFKGMLNYVEERFVLQRLESYAKRRIEALGLPGYVDSSGHVVTRDDAARLGEYLAAQFSDIIKGRNIGSSGVWTSFTEIGRLKIWHRYAGSVVGISVLVAVELFFRFSGAAGYWNLYVVLPYVLILVYFLGEVRNYEHVVDEEYLPMGSVERLWELYKEVVIG